MRGISLIPLICSLAFASSAQVTRLSFPVRLQIDSMARVNVENNTSSANIEANGTLSYKNLLLVDLYRNDSLVVSANRGDNLSGNFNSFYSFENDTLKIEGAFLLEGRTGFTAEIVNGKARIYYLIAKDSGVDYAYNESSKLQKRLEVNTLESKIILSEIPNNGYKGIIYGYIFLKSGEFFKGGLEVAGKETTARRLQRTYMKIYFKSSRINLNKGMGTKAVKIK